MNNGILVKYKGGISKLTKLNEEWIDYEADLSLADLLLHIFKLHRISDTDQMIDKQSVLLIVNDQFVPMFEADDMMLHDGDVVTLLPTISGG